MESSQNKLAKPLTFIGILVVIAGIVGFTNVGKKTTDASPVSTSTDSSVTSTPVADITGGTVAPVATTTSGATQTSKYKDGTYTAQGNYISPGGAQAVSVSLTLKNDIVVASNFQEMPSDRESANYQNRFASGYKVFVIGKSLDQVSVSRVSGASLTPQGFNDAVSKIKVEAKA